MLIRFSIHYHTNYNQRLVITGNFINLGNWEIQDGLVMNYVVNDKWEAMIKIDENIKDFEYKYVVHDTSNGAIFWEGGDNRYIDLSKFEGAEIVDIRDTYKNPNFPEISFLRTKLFEDVIFQREPKQPQYLKKSSSDSFVVTFNVTVCGVEPDYGVFILGNVKELSNWDYKKAIELTYIGSSTYQVDIAFEKPTNFNYKYLILTTKQHKLIQWEDGANRTFTIPNNNSFADRIVFTDLFRSRFDKRFAGVAIPVFSLRSKESLGVGEFLDLKLLVDFCSKIGFRLIQILPITDTSCFLTWRDSYPYSSLSVFALHPIYLRLGRLTKDKNILNEIQSNIEKLNSLPSLDYEMVMTTKMTILRKIYQEHTDGLFKDNSFLDFVERNSHWLTPYAVFKHLTDLYKHTDYTKWKEEHRVGTESLFKEMKDKYKYEIGFYQFIQYHLTEQLKEAVAYGVSKRVGLKGDLPIGINRISVDSWVNSELFNMNMSTGAPPDQFSEDGQNWGFPTYNWKMMKEDGYKWWRDRLSFMSEFFHAFRIDHILGFFRIWEIPIKYESGLMGHYNPSIPIEKYQLDESGLWDIQRLVKPYVRKRLIQSYGFSWHDTKYIANKFFKQYGDDLYEFKEEYDDEKKILNYIHSLPENDDSSKWWKYTLEKCLTGLIKNVVLLKDEKNEYHFYPRVNTSKTSSFNELEDWKKDKLWNLYIAYYYGHAQEEFWREIGVSRLPVIRSATKMLVCGEDLGMVPKCVEPVMNDLGILGLRIQRMPSDSRELFGIPHSYNYLTVCSPSSHDTSTIRGWWEEDRGKTEQFYYHYLGRTGPVPYFCEPDIAEQIISQHLYSPSILAIFLLQDLFSIQHDLRVTDPNSEKINEPSNPKHYWRYRIHVYLEDLLSNESFISKLRDLREKSGRY